MNESPWVIYEQKRQIVICQRCWSCEDIKLPVSVRDFCDTLRVFVEKHKDCKETT